MTPLSKDVRTPALLAESDWLRALARRLVSDEQQSEDAVQDTLLTALGRPGPASRGWLAAVLRNVVRHRGRSDVRRSDREALSHTGALAPSSCEVAERLELQRLLLEAVQELEEPSRTAIVLRFLDGFPPREVAHRTGVSVKTVHGRIDRGVERLRGRLERGAAGGREAWLRVLMPLATPARVFPTSLGVVWMSANLKWTVAAVALLVAGTVMLRGSFFSSDQSTESGLAVAPEGGELLATADVEDVESPPTEDSRRSADLTTTVAPEKLVAVSLALVTLAGRVVDVERREVPGLVVRFQPTSRPNTAPRVDDPPVVSGLDGSFEISIPQVRGRLTASGPGWATLVGPGVHGERPPEVPLVIVGPTHSYGGLIVDQDGEPLQVVDVAVYLPPLELGGRVGWTLAVVAPIGRAQTDDQGRFELEEQAWVSGTTLVARRDGYRADRRELPGESTLELRLVLERISGSAVLTGVVLDGDALPASGAYVSFRGRVVSVGPDGAFAIELTDGEEREGTLRAARRGLLPAVEEVSQEDFLRGDPFTLLLGGPALDIQGRVVDGDDAPLDGALVWTFDGEPFGPVPQNLGELEFQIGATVEEVLSGQVEGGPRAGETSADASGRFQLRGLLDRPYTLYAMHPVTQEVVRVERVAAGRTDVVLALVGSEPTSLVAGVVTTLDGEPISGALLRVIRRVPSSASTERSHAADHDFHAVTDAEGRFRFEALCAEGTSLLLNGEMIPSPQVRELGQEGDLLDVRFEVPAIAWLRVILTSDLELADAVELRNDEGDRVVLTIKVGSVALGMIQAMLNGGRTDLIQTDQAATTLVFLRSGLEVDRIPLRLKPGEINEIRR